MNTCVYSSLVFLTNVVAAYLNGEIIYGTTWLILTCSSVVLHSSRDTDFYRILYWVDQVCIMCIVFCGACLLYLKPLSIAKCLAFVCFFGDIYIHYLSGINVDTDKWHSILHYIGSIGHHCILL
jgi:hypothetical protein